MARGINLLSGSTTPTDGISQLPNNEQLNSNMATPHSEMSIPLQQMAIPVYTPVSREDVNAAGSMLFRNFLRQEFELEGLQSESTMFDRGDSAAIPTLHSYQPSTSLHNNQPSTSEAAVASVPDMYKLQRWIEVGEKIRNLADQFANSPERQEVQQHADQVNLHDISKDIFWTFLSEIFKKGITSQRLITLFFFCSDVLKRSARENLVHICANLFSWSLEYIINNVCQWVHEHGGWERIFNQIWDFAFKAAGIAALIVFVGVGFVYIKKNWIL